MNSSHNHSIMPLASAPVDPSGGCASAGPGDDGAAAMYITQRPASDNESQASLPRSYTLPREFKYYRHPKTRKAMRTDHFVASTNSSDGKLFYTAKSRLYVQFGTQKFGRGTERDVQVKVIYRTTPCKVLWMKLYQMDVQTRGTYNWETYNWDSTPFLSSISFSGDVDSGDENDSGESSQLENETLPQKRPVLRPRPPTHVLRACRGPAKHETKLWTAYKRYFSSKLICHRNEV